ncbi:putative ABC transporter [Pseudocercospora fijiensis CIRAD86]|uniref:Putative ABC transporter n=1 Tax=Pseudocercospora fijiensis (strain CIRAD86) TaxID=383855 RepID=M3AXH3_PSEFD|nr:putative ABC transporter [Pseudocercospora fijiensis CIRAD86]EME81788.1 putative ABC transporter [Pseudocercospora fijiensis CIRAD86]
MVIITACPGDADDRFGPGVATSCRRFDFTLLFEDVFCTLLPCTVFIVAATLRIAILLFRHPDSRLHGLVGPQHQYRLFPALVPVVYLATYVALDGVAFAGAGVAFAAALAVPVLWLVEKWKRGPTRPSMILGLYLCIRLLLRAVTVRTAWLVAATSAYTHTATAALAVHVLVLLGDECSPLLLLRQAATPPTTRESRAGFLSRSVLAWLLALLRAGFARHRRLSVDDLIAVANAPSSFTTLDAFHRGRGGLLEHSLTCTAVPGLLCVAPRLGAGAFAFTQPFLTTVLVDYFSRADKPLHRGYGLTGACFLVYTGIAIAHAWYRTLACRWATAGRALHTDLIVQKLSRLAVDHVAEAQALTMMSSDVQRIAVATTFVHELWAAPLEAGAATYLLWRQLGPSSLAALAIALVCAGLSMILGRRIGPAQRAWLEASERRILATRKFLTSRKAVKMMGLDAAVAATITDSRQQEFAASKPFRALMVGSVVVSFSTLSLAPVVTFGAYVGIHGAAFDAAQLFGSLVLISLLASPLVRVFQIIPHFAAALACIARLETFLRRDDAHAERATIVHSSHPRLQRGIHQVDPEKSLCHSAPHSPGSILIENVHMSWDSHVLFAGINLRIPNGHHLAITGPVGSGKTTLLRLMLGEIAPTDGIIMVDRSVPVGYCAQTPWLENLPAYDNVFQNTAPNDAWRETIIDACAIRPLLDSKTSSAAGEPIGSRGSMLSGGEKQRLALARAVALRPSVLLLDDPLSAVDRGTLVHITNRLFGPGGILRQSQTTVVQIANNDYMASFADEVLRIDADGCLRSHDNYPRSQCNSGDKKQWKMDSQSTNVGQTEKALLHPAATALSSARFTRVRDTQVYRLYFTSIGPGIFTAFIICGMIFALTMKFPNIWATWWADSLTKHSASRSLGIWMGLYALFGCLPLVVLSVWLSLLMLNMVPKSGLGFHAQLLRTVLGATLSCVSGSDIGDLMNRFNQDIGLIDSRLPLSLLNTVSGMFLCIAQLFIVAIPAVYILAALPILLAVLSILQIVYLRTSKQLRQLDLQSKAALHAKMAELHEGLVTIRAHKLQRAKHISFLDKLERSQRPFYIMYVIQAWLQLVLNCIVAGLCTAVVGLSVGMRNSTSASRVGLSMLNLVTLGQSLEDLIEPWTQMETSLAAIARIKSFEMDTPQEHRGVNVLDVPSDWPTDGSLDLQGVWVTYSPEGEKADWALQNVTFRIAAGEKVAICGKTGSGKSTLLLSILALLEPSRGAIVLDDMDITRVPQNILRTRIVTVPQEPYLHGDSVRNAMDAGSDEALREVLQACGLLDKIEAGGGLDSSLSALSLSAGQTQLFVLARTIIHAGKAQGGLILLDESTSSIDHVAAHAMLKLVRARLPSKTVLSILHDLEAAMEFDRIIVLDEGRVTCDGNPADVLQESELFSSLRKDRNYSTRHV